MKIEKVIVIISVFLLGMPSMVLARSKFDRRYTSNRLEQRRANHRLKRHHPIRFKPARYPHHYSKERFVFSHIIKPIISSGLEYFLNDGVFYQRTATNYIVVNAPVGARVQVLPTGYRKEIINNKFYYFYKNVCYKKIRNGFVVVNAPRRQSLVVINNTELMPARSIEPVQVFQEEDQKSFTVNVPNKNGSHTSVILAKREEGYVGPQGELYFDFPSVEQLKVMYGK